MGVVDYAFYTSVYMGEAEQSDFPRLNARASDVIGALTRWAVNESNICTLPPAIQNLYRKAICAQIDFFYVNGVDSVNDSGNGGFTVGKVTVNARKSDSSGGAMSGNISPAAVMFLEQTGLMNPQVPTFGGWL